MSRFERDGVACVSLRPPVTVAMQMYFKAQNTAVTVSSAQAWTVLDGPEVVTFVLEGMRPHDAIACNAAANIGFVTAAGGKTLGVRAQASPGSQHTALPPLAGSAS